MAADDDQSPLKRLPLRRFVGLSRVPIRLRLTMIFAVAMSLVLMGSGVIILERVRSQVDARLDLDVSRQAQSLLAHAQGSRSGLVQAVAHPDRAGRGGVAQVLDRHGRILASTPAVRRLSLLSGRRLQSALRHSLRFDHKVRDPHHVDLRLLSTPIRIAGHGDGVLIVGMSADQRTASVESLTLALLIVGPIALLTVILVGYRLTAAALRPVEMMRRRALTISAAQPGVRLPLPASDDEIRQLGLTLNAMLERLEGAFARERTFVANASHELRTPLSNLRAEIDLAVRRPRPAGELLEALHSAQVEVERLSALADGLLVLARADEDELHITAERFRIAEVVSELRLRHASTGRAIEYAGPADETVVADRLRVQQALANLVDNALRYGEGTVVVAAETDQKGNVELHVRDRGPGFPSEFLDHAFERFSRADPARTAGGHGLGLSIVEQIARAHGGEAHVANWSDGADAWLVIPAPPGA